MLGGLGALNKIGVAVSQALTPSLNLDFTLGSLDSRITFTRGSQATLFDSAGTLVYAKHNLLLQSQTFQTTWINTNSSEQIDVEVAPDGTTTADKLVEDTAAGAHAITQTSVSFAAFTYTASVYLKAAGRSFARIIIQDGASAFFTAYFNLSTGAVGNLSGTGTVASAINVGNGWYRCLVTAPLAAGAGSVAIRAATANGTDSYTGDGTSGIFIWGAQLNLANMEGGVTSSLTTYYPTTTAAYYGPRFDYDPSTLAARGLLIEEARTNSIRNNTMVGAAAGTPGTLPTNWSVGGLGTLTQTVVGTGTQNGINYVDLRFNGTTSTTQLTLRFEQTGIIAAANGQSWAVSSWISIVGGSSTNITNPNLATNLFDAGGAYIGEGPNATVTLTSTLTRYAGAGTISNASTASIRPYFYILFASGVAIDITLRIGLPQLEQGAFATSVIPTSTVAVTRSADVASMTGTNFSSWYNASEGTIYTDVSINYTVPTGQFPPVVRINDGTSSNLIQAGYLTADNSLFEVTTGGVNQAVFYPTATGIVNRRQAGAYKLNDIAVSLNGGVVNTDTSATIPTVTQLLLGSFGGSGRLNGYLRRISYYPSRLPDGTLQALTA